MATAAAKATSGSCGPAEGERRLQASGGGGHRRRGVQLRRTATAAVAARARVAARGHDGDDLCAICDDGGFVVCCDGGCLRAFHPTEESGQSSKCTSLGLSAEQVEYLGLTKKNQAGKRPYICKNCEYKQHQCFACRLLGSSDMFSGAEVFQCSEDTCGFFYHPECLARIVYPDSKIRAMHFAQLVAGGLEFYCPVHRCCVCVKRERKNNKEMQLAVCRRCPTAYHKKCLPSDIAFKNRKGVTQRAWNNIIPGQILIYCMRHEIEKDLRTPSRNHLIFPCGKKSKRSKVASEEQDDALDEVSSGDEDSDAISNGSENVSNNSNQRGRLMKSGHIVRAEMDSSGWNTDFMSLDDSDVDALGKVKLDVSDEDGLDNTDGKDEPPDRRPPSEHTQTPRQNATGHNPSPPFDPMNSFAPKALYPCPQPGSCGWIDD